MDQPRHVEVGFHDDDALVMAWCMATPAEAEGIIAAVIDAYGAPIRSNAVYVAFGNDRTAWRHEPAEIYAPKLDANMAPDCS